MFTNASQVQRKEKDSLKELDKRKKMKSNYTYDQNLGIFNSGVYKSHTWHQCSNEKF